MLVGNRYYDSSIGRFISQDPIRAGDNWYAYCDNNPLSHIDPNGLLWREIGSISGAIVGGIIGGFPGAVIGAGIGGGLGSAADGSSPRDAAIDGIVDAGATLIGGKVIGI